VTRSVGDDELPPFGREVTVRDVDRDLLLALGDEAVEKEREVKAAVLCAKPRRVALKRG
jgi:hypothetical protein